MSAAKKRVSSKDMDFRKDHDVAIIGMAGCFPHSGNLDAFWDNLLHGLQCFDPVPEDRWASELFFSRSINQTDRTYVNRGAFLEKVSDFPALHFGKAPKMVQVMDPQHRLLLDAVRIALQDAGLERLSEEKEKEKQRSEKEKTGVFLGVSTSEFRSIQGNRIAAIELSSGRYGTTNEEGVSHILDSVSRILPISPFSMPGNLLNMAAANIAHHWGFGGPAYTIDAACASSLVAVYDAVIYLRSHVCDRAVAGGVYLNFTSDNYLCMSRIGAISKKGNCKPFDAQADGFLQGEGCGIVILKRLEDAIRDGNRVHAVIRGIGINNDGSYSTGPMSPSADGQTIAIRNALEDSGIEPHTLEHIECHSTATITGDPVEVQALRNVLDKGGKKPKKVWLASVKGNIGHAMSAAGVASLIKAVLSLQNRTIPPQAGFETLNPALGIDDQSIFAIPTKPIEWKTDKHPRRAGISSLGFGGTNCHIIVEEAPEEPESMEESDFRSELVLITAPNLKLLRKHALEIADALDRLSEKKVPLKDIAYTLNAARKHEKMRLALVATSLEDLASTIRMAVVKKGLTEESFQLGPKAYLSDPNRTESPKIAFMFPGQGAQRVGLLYSLYEKIPFFKKYLDELQKSLGGILPRPLLSYLYPKDMESPEKIKQTEEELKETEICQPVMASLGLALTHLLEGIGIKPTLLFGHSLGEFPAAAAGGILDPKDALAFVAKRGLAIAEAVRGDKGSMAAVSADRLRVSSILKDIKGVVVANINHPKQTVISGSTDSVNKAIQELARNKLAVKTIPVSHAFHSPIIAEALDKITSLVSELKVKAAKIPVFSTTARNLYPLEGNPDIPGIKIVFADHARLQVDFMAAVKHGIEQKIDLFLEVGAGTILSSFTRAILAEKKKEGKIDNAKEPYVLSLASREPDQDISFHQALAQLAGMGQEIHFQTLYEGRGCRVISLPPTLLESEEYWPVVDEPIPVKLPQEKTGERKGRGYFPDRKSLVALAQKQADLLEELAEITFQQKAILEDREPALDLSKMPPRKTEIEGEEAGEKVDLAVQIKSEVAKLIPTKEAGGGASVLNTVFDLVSKVSAFPKSSLNADQNLGKDLGFDSLMLVDLLEKVQGAFPSMKDKIPQSILNENLTIRALVEYITTERGIGPAEAAPALDKKEAEPAQERAPEKVPLLLYKTVVVERRRTSLAGSLLPLSGPVIITSDSKGIAEFLAERFSKAGESVILVELGKEHKGIETSLGYARLSWPRLPEKMGSLFQLLAKENKSLPMVIHLAEVGQEIPSSISIPPEAALASSLFLTQNLAKALHESCEIPAAFVVVTAMGGKLGFEELDGREQSYWQSGLNGFSKSLAKEWPSATIVKAIDISLEEKASSIADQVFDEITGADVDQEVGLVKGQRFVPVLESISMDKSIGTPAIDKDSVVLITGGGTGIGAKIALSLAENHKCSLVLIGRRSPSESEDLKKNLEAVTLAGSRVEYVQWDVRSSFPPAVLKEAIKKMGRVSGIIHCAGVIRDSRIEKKSFSDLREVLETKVFGLHHVLTQVHVGSLKFIAAFSSWATKFGNLGQTDYAAANEMMTRYIRVMGKRYPKSRFFAIHWPPWEHSAMTETIPEAVRSAMRLEGVPFLTDQEGIDAFLRTLDHCNEPEAMVGTGNFPFRPALKARFSLSLSTHPYLDDHRLKDDPLLPFAAAVDYMALAAFEADKKVFPFVMRNMKLFAGLSMKESVSIHVTVTSRDWVDKDPIELRIKLRKINEDSTSTLLYRTEATCGGDGEIENREENCAGEAPSLDVGEFYENHTFHGPRLRAIEKILSVGETCVSGEVRTSLPSDLIPDSARKSWAVDPLVIDGSFQLVAYWLWVKHKKRGFPTGFDRFVLLRPFPSGRITCVIKSEEDIATSFRGDILFKDPEGNLLAKMSGVRGAFLPPEEEKEPETRESKAAHPDKQVRSPKIENLPEIEGLRKRFEAAEKSNLSNPYFIPHDGVAREVAVIEGREYINFSSYNYLGFSGDPAISSAAKKAIDEFGTSVSASRLATGEIPLHSRLEKQIAELLGVEAALVFSSGHATNESVIGHLCGEGDLIIHDAFAHNSIQQGAVMSGARRRPFPHNDWKTLDKLLGGMRSAFNKCLIAIEGVYSMDGDIPDLPQFIEVKEKHGCFLYVDEAHSLGIIGKTGRGIGEHFQVDPISVEIWMGTLSKSFASCGGFVAGKLALIEYLKYTTPGFVFSAGISPANTAAASAAIEEMLRHPEKVEMLQQQARKFLQLAKEKDIDTGLSNGAAVVPCIVGNSLKCMKLSKALAERGINVQPIVYPAVEEEEARLRFFISAFHTDEQIEKTISILTEELSRL